MGALGAVWTLPVDIRARETGGRRYPWPVTPEQLSATIVDGLSALVDEGALTLPDGVPTEVTVERPRQKGHGDYATNVALQLAKRAGMNPRAFGRASRRPAARGRRHRRGRGRRAGLPQHHGRGRARRARSRPTIVAAGASYGAHRRVRGREDQPRVRLGQPDRPAPHRRRAVGGRRRRARPDLHDDRGRGHPGVLLQRPRRPDRPVRRSLLASAQGRAAPEDGYGGDYIAEIAAAVGAARPEVLDLPDDEAQELFRPDGVD